jgi:hypothetical protein
VAEPLIELLSREYAHLREREGRDFFLALAPYTDGLRGKWRLRRVLRQFEHEAMRALKRFVAEQNGFIEEARRIRADLAERAPEVDNSDMEEPDPGSGLRATYELDSFAGFDQLAGNDVSIAYPSLPKDDADPGPLRTLIIILRGRLRAAMYGEDSPPKRPKVPYGSR